MQTSPKNKGRSDKVLGSNRRRYSSIHLLWWPSNSQTIFPANQSALILNVVLKSFLLKSFSRSLAALSEVGQPRADQSITVSPWSINWRNEKVRHRSPNVRSIESHRIKKNVFSHRELFAIDKTLIYKNNNNRIIETKWTISRIIARRHHSCKVLSTAWWMTNDIASLDQHFARVPHMIAN